ncbi:MAG: ABC-2 family transporter protein [Candidatus Kerfeldbacteria bacterium]|nr:ABC-2 family transporter protein [Candidatus Kerfeldbacteria bacterium]
MQRYIRLFFRYLSTDIIREAEFRGGFFLLLVSNLIEFTVTVAFFSLLYGSVPTVGGWSYPEALFLVATYSIIGNLSGAFFLRNFARFSEYIRTGLLDTFLTKPVDAQFAATLRYHAISNLISLLPSVALLMISLHRLGLTITVVNAVGYVLLLVLGLIIVYCLWFAISLLAFWLTQINELQELWFSLYDFARYPPPIYDGGVRILFTFVIPVLTVVAVPTEFFLEHTQPAAIGYNVAIAATLLIVTRLLWKVGLRRYASASS